ERGGCGAEGGRGARRKGREMGGGPATPSPPPPFLPPPRQQHYRRTPFFTASSANDPTVAAAPDSLRLQLTLVQRGVGVALVAEPSTSHYALVPVKTSAALREAVGGGPSDELFLVTPSGAAQRASRPRRVGSAGRARR